VEVTKKSVRSSQVADSPRSGDVPMTVEHVAVSYGSLKVLKDVNFITRRGDGMSSWGQPAPASPRCWLVSRHPEGAKGSREVRRRT